MNVARTCNAEDVRVRLCFLVNVRKATGRRVAGGRRIGRILGFEIGAMVNDRTGWAGVAKAGDEDGIGLRGAGVAGGRNIGAARGISFWLGRLILEVRRKILEGGNANWDFPGSGIVDPQNFACMMGRRDGNAPTGMSCLACSTNAYRIGLRRGHAAEPQYPVLWRTNGSSQNGRFLLMSASRLIFFAIVHQKPMPLYP
jgi:hypothetical protein